MRATPKNFKTTGKDESPSPLNSLECVNFHFHCVFLEGVYLDCTQASRKPRFVKGEPPSDTDIATVNESGLVGTLAFDLTGRTLVDE